METRRRIVMRLFQTMTRDISAVTVDVRIERDFLDPYLGLGHFLKELNLVDPMLDQCVGSVSVMTAIDCARKRPQGSVSKSVTTSLATPKATYKVCIIWRCNKLLLMYTFFWLTKKKVISVDIYGWNSNPVNVLVFARQACTGVTEGIVILATGFTVGNNNAFR